MTKFNATLAAIAFFGTLGAAQAADTGLAQFANAAVVPTQHNSAVADQGVALAQFAQSAKLPQQAHPASEKSAAAEQSTSLVRYAQSAVIPAL